MEQNKYKIAVYAICKNEAQFVDRWMDAVSEADMVIVTDTGSTDDTVARLRARGAVVYTEKIQPWRFDTARNAALSHVPEDVDICVSNDLDEVFIPGWRALLEAAWQPSHTSARYLFTCNYHPDGTPNKQHAMEKIHARQGFEWVRPVHETLKYNGEKPEQKVWVAGLVLNHHPDVSKPRTQYLPLLELTVQENPQDSQVVFWLGREYLFHRQYDDAIRTLKDYLDLPSSKWEEERSAAMRFIARSYQYKEDTAQARVWLYRAIGECPYVREPYIALARLGYLQGDWPLVYLMIERALEIKTRTGSYLLELDCWGYVPFDLGAIACYRLELFERARELAEQALAQSPQNNRLRKNLELINERLEQQTKEKADGAANESI